MPTAAADSEEPRACARPRAPPRPRATSTGMARRNRSVRAPQARPNGEPRTEASASGSVVAPEVAAAQRRGLQAEAGDGGGEPGRPGGPQQPARPGDVGPLGPEGGEEDEAADEHGEAEVADEAVGGDEVVDQLRVARAARPTFGATGATAPAPTPTPMSPLSGWPSEDTTAQWKLIDPARRRARRARPP